MHFILSVALSAALVCGSSPQYVSSYSNYYQPSGPSYPSGGSDYYNYQPHAASQSITSRLQGIFQGFTDRTDPGFFAAAPFLLLSMLALVGLAVTGIAYAVVTSNSSGRGLDTDNWEVDHSVWMEQLQKDFEDSWSTE